jgi:hypothetical protein
MLPSTQPEANERTARHLCRLASGGAGRKTQFFLEAVASAWAPELRSCLGRTKWHVAPRAEDMPTVTAHAEPAWPARVRVAALAAVAHAGAHAPLVGHAIKHGLCDADRSVRLAAARAAAEANLGDTVAQELRSVLDDDVWAVRWHAARGLVARAFDSELGSLAHMLVKTTPRAGMALTSWAHAARALRPRCRVAGQSDELEAHVTRLFASLSARDRDFAWPLWR